MEIIGRDFHHNDTKSPSPEMFSFPGTPTEELDGDNSEFEFGSCVTPSSPVTPNELSKNSNSPADQFFLNGRLLPHDFPSVPTSSRTSFSGRENLTYNTTANTNNNNSNAVINLSRGTSIGSNMSITSSRSNSSNSSTCSNARGSSSEVSERKTFHQKSRMMHMKGYCRTASVREQRNGSSCSRLGKYYGLPSSSGGSSQRWQFIIPAPVLGPSLSRRSMVSTTSPKKSTGSGSSNSNSSNGGFFNRIFRSLVATCKACHAMEGHDHEFDLDEGSIVGSCNSK